MSVQLITDSTSDFTKEEWTSQGVEVVSLNVDFAGNQYKDLHDLMPDAFYELLEESETLPKTSQPAPGSFLEVFEKYPDQEIVVLPMSKELSGTYQSALLARQMSGRDDIYVVDTLQTAQGLRLLVDEAIALRDAQKTGKEIADAITELKDHIQLIAVVDTLEYLYKGGRLSRSVMMAGNFLHIHPVIGLSDGKIVMFSKARGKKSIVREVEKLMEQHEVDPSRAYFGYSGKEGTVEMEAFRDPLVEKYGFRKHSTSQIGALIGTHTGPGLRLIVYKFR